MNAKTYYTRAVGFSIVLFAVIALLVAFVGRIDVRLDLTESGLYTVSDETRRILGQLTDRVTIQYWVSEEVPTGFHNIRRDTSDYLKEFERLAGGQIKIEVNDPREWIDEQIRIVEEKGDEEDVPPPNPFAQFDPSKLPLKDRKKYEFSEQFGIPEVRGRSYEQDKIEERFFYSGIRITYGDRPAETIPIHQTLDGLEYELASRLVKLTIQDKPKVAFFHGRPSDVIEVPSRGGMPGAPPTKISPYQPVLDSKDMQALFDIVPVTLTSEETLIPSDADLLIVAQPDALSERQLYEIDRFVAEGGSTIFMVSRFSGNTEQYTIQQLTPSVDRLFAKWGVSLGREVVSSAECGGLQQLVNTAFGQVPQERPFPLAPAANGTNVDQSSPLTLGIGRIVFGFAVALTHDPATVESAGLTLTTLAKSGDDSWSSPFTVQWAREMFEPTSEVPKQSFDLAYFLEGALPFSFEVGSPIPEFEASDPPEEGEAPAEKPLIPAIDSKPGRVVVMASCDFAKISQLQVRSNQISFSFLMNCFETLSLGGDLVNIRAKGQKSRLLAESKPFERSFAKWGNILGVPVLVLLFGGARYLIRRTVAYAYEENYLRENQKENA